MVTPVDPDQWRESIGWMRTLAGAYRERIARDGPDPDDPEAEQEMLREVLTFARELKALLAAQSQPLDTDEQEGE